MHPSVTFATQQGCFGPQATFVGGPVLFSLLPQGLRDNWIRVKSGQG